jgi:hypothetical protein
MHPSAHRYVQQMVGTYGLQDRAHLDIGSLDENGTTRDLFTYTVGLDYRPGPGVDFIADAHQIDGLGFTPAVITCTEMLEHDSRPWETVAECFRVLISGGYFIVTARGFDERGCFPVHGYPCDYWRYSKDGIVELLSSAGFDVLDARRDPEEIGVFVTAIKP